MSKRYEYSTEREDSSTTVLTVKVDDSDEGKGEVKAFKVLDPKNEFTVVLEGITGMKPAVVSQPQEEVKIKKGGKK